MIQQLLFKSCKKLSVFFHLKFSISKIALGKLVSSRSKKGDILKKKNRVFFMKVSVTLAEIKHILIVFRQILIFQL